MCARIRAYVSAGGHGCVSGVLILLGIQICFICDGGSCGRVPLYFWLGCRRNLKLINFENERIKRCCSWGRVCKSLFSLKAIVLCCAALRCAALCRAVLYCAVAYLSNASLRSQSPYPLVAGLRGTSTPMTKKLHSRPITSKLPVTEQ